MSSVEPLQTLKLDAEEQRHFVSYYHSLPPKSPGTVRIFSRTGYYTVHEEDAVYAANELFGRQTVNYMGDEPKLSYVVLNMSNFEKLARSLLLLKQYRIEVYAQTMDSRGNDWDVEYNGSPGNLTQFEQLLFQYSDLAGSSGIMAINIVKGNMVAVAYVNVPEAQFLVTEFNDNDLFTEIETLIAQMNPSECVIPQGESVDLTRINQLMERNGLLISKVKKSEFKSNDIEQDLNRLLYFQDKQINAMALPETKLSEAMNCLQVLIKHLNLEANECSNHFTLSHFDISRFVHIDNAAFSALNLFAKPGTPENQCSNKNTHVFGMLNKCLTQQGRRLLQQWIKQPLRDKNLITERLEVVQAFVNHTEIRHLLSNSHLTRVPDLLIVLNKLTRKKVTLQDCYRIYQSVMGVPHITNVLKKMGNKYVTDMLLKPMSNLLVDVKKYPEMIEHTLDLDLVDRGEYFIRPDFNKVLQALAKRRAVLKQQMQKTLQKVAEDLGVDIKLDCTEQTGYCYRISLKQEKLLRKKKNYKTLGIAKGGVRFTNDIQTKLNELYLEINGKYKKEQEAIVQQIVDIAVGYTNVLRNLNMYIAKVDVLVSFANVAVSAPIPFIKPNLHPEGSGILKLRNVRHPCLELQDNITFIPNDVEFIKDHKNFYVITGPNMGGKSTYIRSVGISVLLAHIGCFVPCAEAEISIVDSILARIGARDYQMRGISTFMMEMIEVSTIIKSATSNSLVIIDELGRGTCTYDGCGIAWAVVENLALEIKSFSLFATHFHEITQLAEKHNTIHNLHVTAVITDKTVTPLYQVREGPCGKSFGIQCAQMAGFPQDVLDMATEYQKELEDEQGMKYIKDLDTTLRYRIIQEGNLIITEFLRKCKAIDLTASREEVTEIINKLKAEVPRDNLYIKGLLEK